MENIQTKGSCYRPVARSGFGGVLFKESGLFCVLFEGKLTFLRVFFGKSGLFCVLLGRKWDYFACVFG